MDHRKRAKELVAKMTLAEKCAQMRYDAPAIERLGVKAYNWWNECLHGVGRSGTATVFPQAIGMAASFNPDLLYEVATAISDEARAKYNEYKKFGSTLIYQGLTFWSPNINIFRDPRWGRGHETYGEDPLLTGKMGVAFVKGLQGDDPKYRKVDATLKHYAVHSGPESERHSFNAIASEEDLRETYLWAFKYCIDHASPSAVMGSYNRINGEPACGSKTYLKETLYGKFGFDGYVVSDCGAICDFDQYHKITETPLESAALAVNNGCTLNCGEAYKWLKAAVAAGKVSEETITEAVERLFEARFRLGMFDDDCVYDQIPYEVIDCDKHRELNRRMAQESIVLLKNDGILPLKNPGKIAVIGPNADDKSVLLGNYEGTPARYTTILRGIQDAAPGKVYYARGCHIYDDEMYSWQEKPLREAIIAAQKSDVVILCMGLNPTMEGEEGDAYNGALGGDKADLELPASQKKLLEEIIKVGKPIVFLNVSGSCINLTRADEACNAVLQVFYPGAEGGNAVADILFGKVSPSGKLPVTFYRSTDDLPDFRDYSMANRTYKYFKGEPLYPFGHGLSYTKFSIADVCFDSKKATLTITNEGDYDGSEVVKVFARDRNNSRLNCRLVGFQKVFLKRGESARIQVDICQEVMELFDDNSDIEFFIK